jgi:site-specific DNA recombinase
MVKLINEEFGFKEMIAAIYCRVSTEEQGKEGTSLESQQKACLKKAAELGFEVPNSLIFVELYSGLRLDRPKLNILREKIRNKEINAVIAYTTDRLSRDPVHFIILQEKQEKAKVELILVTESVDGSDIGKLISHIRGYAAKIEIEKFKERSMRGKRTVAERGRIPQGTGVGLYGYTWNKEIKKRVLDKDEIMIVEKIFTMIANCNSRFKVASTLNTDNIATKSRGKWHPLTIERLITNSAYIGKTYFGRTKSEGDFQRPVPQDKWLFLPDATPAIISEELFNRANKVLKQGKELHHGRPQHDYLLTGHIKCGYCGNPLIGSCLSHKYRYYHCRGAYPTSTRKAICKAKYIDSDQIEEIVWEKVKEVVENPKVIQADLKRRMKGQSDDSNNIDIQISSIQSLLQDYVKQQQKLIDLARLDQIANEAVIAGLNRINLEKQEADKKLAHLMKSKSPGIDPIKAEAQIKEYCKRVKRNIKNCSYTDKRYALDALGVTVIATDDKIEVKISVPLEFTPIEKISEHILISGKKYRKQELELKAAIEQSITVAG